VWLDGRDSLAGAAVLADAARAAVDVLVTGDLLEATDSPVVIVSPRGLWEKFHGALKAPVADPRGS